MRLAAAVCGSSITGGRIAAGVLVVHVDAQDRGQQVADVLAGLELVGRAGFGTVAGGDVEEAVGAEVDVAGVVAALEPGEDDLLALGDGPRRVGGRDAEA